MAKKKPRGQLGDWTDTIPEDVQEAADAYDSAHKAAQNAKAKFNSARDRVIEKMREKKIKRVPIRNGEKFLVYRAKDGVVIKKPQEKPGVDTPPANNGATEDILDKAAKEKA